jgi:hypothetical protein
MHFVQVIPAHEDWARMAHGLKRIDRKSEAHMSQSLEEVRDEVTRGRANWCVIKEGDDVLADIVLKTLQEDNSRTLYIWLAFGKQMRDWSELAMSAFVEIARLNGCKKLRYCTSRPEMIQLFTGTAQGWMHTHVFEKEI